MDSSKWNSGGVVLEDFVYWGLSLIVLELEDGRSHATAFEVGLTLYENESVVCQEIKLTACGGGEKGREV